MQFRNKSDLEMNFSLGAIQFKVAPRDYVFIPDVFEYAVESMGLLLEKVIVKPEETLEEPIGEVKEVVARRRRKKA